MVRGFAVLTDKFSLTTVKLEKTARPLFAKSILEHQKQYQLEDKELEYRMFTAGSDMISSSLQHLLI
jgi:hypothetical protein